MAAQELIFGFKFISRSGDRFTYGTPDYTIPVFMNSSVSTYNDKLLFTNIKTFDGFERSDSGTIVSSPNSIYSPSINRSDVVIGGQSSTKGHIVNLSGWKPNIYDEGNKAYYMLDYVSYIDGAGKETTTKTNAIVAHYKMFIPVYSRVDNVDTLIEDIEARNMSTSMGNYSITGIANRTDSTDSAVIDEAYHTPVFSQNMLRFVEGDNVYYSNYSFAQAKTCSSYDEIVQWLRSTSIKTAKSNNNITVNVSIPSAYRNIYVSNTNSPIEVKEIPARYKLFLIRNTPGRKSTKKTIDNEKIIIPHSYLINGTRWSHPVPKDRAQYDFTEYFSADTKYDFTYTFDLTNILEQEYKTTDDEFYLKHCADTGSWRTSKELDHSQWIFSVVMVLETNYWYDESDKTKTYILLNKTDTGYDKVTNAVPWAERCTKIDYTSVCRFDIVK